MSPHELNDPSAPMYRRNYRTHLAIDNNNEDYALNEETFRSAQELCTDAVVTDDRAPLLTVATRSSSTENDSPTDHYNLLKFAFLLLGLVSLLPWNVFINAFKYWMFKLRDLDSSEPYYDSQRKTKLQAEFLSVITIVSCVAFLIVWYFSTFINKYVPQKSRNISALLMVTVLFAWVTAYVLIDTDSWQHGFYQLTLAQIFLMALFAAWYHGGLMALVANFPREYADLCVTGQSAGGVLASLVELIVLFLKISPAASALLYFAFAIFVLLASIAMVLFIQTLTFFKLFVRKAGSPMNSTRALDEFFDMEVRTTFLIRKTWRSCVALILTYVATFGVYPGILVHVMPSAKDNPAWSDLFTPVACFLVFNVGDLFGRMLCSYLGFPAKRERLLLGLSLSRLMIVPSLFLCNIKPRVSYLPVLFHDDFVFIVMNALFAISNGYLTSVTMVTASKRVERFLHKRVETIMVAMLATGMCLGSVTSLILARLLFPVK